MAGRCIHRDFNLPSWKRYFWALVLVHTILYLKAGSKLRYVLEGSWNLVGPRKWESVTVREELIGLINIWVQ